MTTFAVRSVWWLCSGHESATVVNGCFAQAVWPTGLRRNKPVRIALRSFVTAKVLDMSRMYFTGLYLSAQSAKTNLVMKKQVSTGENIKARVWSLNAQPDVAKRSNTQQQKYTLNQNVRTWCCSVSSVTWKYNAQKPKLMIALRRSKCHWNHNKPKRCGSLKSASSTKKSTLNWRQSMRTGRNLFCSALRNTQWRWLRTGLGERFSATGSLFLVSLAERTRSVSRVTGTVTKTATLITAQIVGRWEFRRSLSKKVGRDVQDSMSWLTGQWLLNGELWWEL